MDELQQQISTLRKEHRSLMHEDDEEFLQRAQVNVGRCFFKAKTSTWAKVIEVPRVQMTVIGPDLNRYQYPAIFIGKDPNDKGSEIPFYMDTIFSGIWGEGHDTERGYVEVSPEEFDAEFKKALKEFDQFISSVGGTK